MSATRRTTVATLSLALAGWVALAWLSFDMNSEVALWMMPGDPDWDAVNLLAIGAMWAVMMAAMMLPSALPMIRTFGNLSLRRGAPDHARAFVGGYLLVWTVFSAAATGAQWLLQAAGWTNPMIVSTSAPLTAALLLVAGLYQFSPLKRLCLRGCRTPLAFVLGAWRPGARGAWAMGWQHGWLCVGCCWALMALLFVGGAMNLAWVAALSVAVAIEKMVPGGERIASVLGALLIVMGLHRLLQFAI
jgi:predicted metal-binding membrane protein